MYDAGGCRTPGLKIFRANAVFRVSACCSKFLNDKKFSIYEKFLCDKNISILKKYFNPVKNVSFFRASASCSKMLDGEKTFQCSVFSAYSLGGGPCKVS